MASGAGTGAAVLWRVTVSLKTNRCRISPLMRKPLHLVTSNGVTPSLTVSAPAFCVTRTPINRLSVLYHQTHRRHAGRFAGHQTAEDCSGVITGARNRAPVLTGFMILKQDLKWSPDGMRVEVILAGEYDDGALPARLQEIALQAGLAERGTSAKAVFKREKATTSKEG